MYEFLEHLSDVDLFNDIKIQIKEDQQAVWGKTTFSEEYFHAQ